MQSNTKIKKEKKYGLCMFLLLIPVFFFSAPLYMGKRGKNDGYTKLGLFYGICSLVTFVVSVLGLVWPVLLYALISHAIVWMLCTMHTLNCRQQYRQYAQWAEEDLKRSELTEQPSFRLRNTYWTFWNYIPLLGGFSTYFMGAKLGDDKLKWTGVISTLVSAAIVFYLTVFAQQVNPWIAALSLAIGYCCICMHPLLALYFFEDYMDAVAEQWTEDISEYPQIENKSWRIKNSLWQIITFVPSFGSMGLFWAGITRENIRVILTACGLFVLEMACLSVPALILGNEALIQAKPLLEGVAAGINVMGIFVWALIVCTGTLIRQDMLRIRAEQEMQF